MKKVFKYPLIIADRQSIELPYGEQILSVQNQREQLFIWALVDPDCATRKVNITIVGTGHPLYFENGDGYIGTVQQHDGTLVWHVFRG